MYDFTEPLSESLANVSVFLHLILAHRCHIKLMPMTHAHLSIRVCFHVHQSVNVCTDMDPLDVKHMLGVSIQPSAVKLDLCGHWMHPSYMHQ